MKNVRHKRYSWLFGMQCMHPCMQSIRWTCEDLIYETGIAGVAMHETGLMRWAVVGFHCPSLLIVPNVALTRRDIWWSCVSSCVIKQRCGRELHIPIVNRTDSSTCQGHVDHRLRNVNYSTDTFKRLNFPILNVSK